MTLPNGSQISLPRCEGEFTYAGNAGKIELRADISNYWYELITNYDFRNGSFSTSSSTSSTLRWVPEFYSVSDSTPDRDEWVDITLRVKNSSSYSSDYDGRVNFRVEEYRNGRWQSASSYDYDLDKTSYYFSSSDRGEVRFNDLVRFRTEGEFRVIAETSSHRQNAYQTFYVNTSSSSSSSNNYWNSHLNFTDKELSKIRAVAKIWNELMIALEKDYPRLRNSKEWRRLSNNFYDSMQDILNTRSSAKYRNWKEFYAGFQEWLSFTVRTR